MVGKKQIPFVRYTTGVPDWMGVYACRVATDYMIDDRFLVWMDNEWWYVGSAEKCRYEVLGWIGPLARGAP